MEVEKIAMTEPTYRQNKRQNTKNSLSLPIIQTMTNNSNNINKEKTRNRKLFHSLNKSKSKNNKTVKKQNKNQAQNQTQAASSKPKRHFKPRNKKTHDSN